MGPWAMADVASRRKLAKSFMEGLDSLGVCDENPERRPRLADTTRLCAGQRGAATTTEGLQRRHRFRVGWKPLHGQEFQSTGGENSDEDSTKVVWAAGPDA